MPTKNSKANSQAQLAVQCSALLACPFCGGPADIELVENCGDTRKVAGCNTEFCQGYQSAHTFATHREAAEAWNRRHLIEKLRRRRIWTDRKRGIEKALAEITDEWIEGGNCCHQTTMDLRDALKAALAG